MNADGFFAIGKAHKVCQDYVRTGVTSDGRAYVIVADGCSSSKDTDIGARLLALTTEIWIQAGKDLIIPAVAAMAMKRADLLGLPTTCLDATLLTAVTGPDGGVSVTMTGDGVLAVRRQNNTEPLVFQMEYPGGAPFYPSYHLDTDRRASFDRMPDNQYRAFLDGELCTLWETGRPTDRDGRPAGDDTGQASDRIWRYDRGTVKIPLHCPALVVLMTDGATSFRDTGGNSVPVRQVVEQVVDVKVGVGEFMTRRCKKFLSSHCVRQGWSHHDDFSVGALIDEGTP